ncbi:MAG: c-type cytochrome [Chthoniobacterales bacterium]
MIKFLLGLILGIGLVVGGAFLYFTRGGLQMSTDGPPLPLERYIAHHALASSIGKASDEKSPVAADEATFLTGAQVYKENGCIGCHGRFGQGPSAMSRRMYPHIPPLLPPSKGVTDDPVGGTHWVVKNGIRFSGMPSFSPKLSDTEIWQVSELLRNADHLPPSVQEVLRGKQ